MAFGTDRLKADVTPAGEDSTTLHVGEGTEIAGAVADCENVVIAGMAKADLTVRKMFTVRPTGTIEGSVDAREALIEGRFEGRLVARDRLTVGAGARIHGVVRYGSLQIEPGGQLFADLDSLPGGDAVVGEREGE